MSKRSSSKLGLTLWRFHGCLPFARRSVPLAVCFFLRSTAFGEDGLTLHEAIQRALQSPNTQIAEGQVDVAQGQLRQAALGPNPRLYLQSEDLRPWSNDFSFANNTEDYGYVSQTFETDGKRRKRVDLAKANLHRSEAERALRIRQIAATVAAAYWTAIANRRIEDLLQKDLIEMDTLVQYHKERVDAGAMRGVDLLRMQIERDRTFLSLQAAQRDADLARIELAKAIGAALPPNVKLSEDLSSIDQLPTVDMAIALAQRTDVLVAQDQVLAAEAGVKLQHALGVPDPDLLAGYKRNSGTDTGYLAVQIPLPFRNRNQGEIASAEAQLRIAKASLQQTQIVARADIEAASANYDRETAIVRDTLPKIREEARHNLDILTEAYRIGGVDLLRYVDAERTEIDVEVTAIRTLAEFHQAALRLQLAVGGQP